MPGPKERLVALQRFEMVSVGAQADVSVGTHHQKCGVLDAEELGSLRLEVPDMVRLIGLCAEGEGRSPPGPPRRSGTF